MEKMKRGVVVAAMMVLGAFAQASPSADLRLIRRGCFGQIEGAAQELRQALQSLVYVEMRHEPYGQTVRETQQAQRQAGAWAAFPT